MKLLSGRFIAVCLIAGLAKFRRGRPADVATLSVHCASGGVLFDVFPDLGDHDGAFSHHRGHNSPMRGAD